MNDKLPPIIDRFYTERYKIILKSMTRVFGVPPQLLGISPPLHCYDNGYFTIVAASLEDAHQNFDEWTQTARDQWGEDEQEEWEEFHELYQIPDDRIVKIFIEDELSNRPAGVVINEFVWEATAAAWAQSQGKGFLCSVEY